MAFDLDVLVRDNIKSLTPYSSARSELNNNSLVLLDANENGFGPFNDSSDLKFNRYPDPNQSKIKTELANASGLTESQIFVGNGSGEAIDIIFRVFCRPGIDNILICPPTYGMFEVSARINDVAVKRASLTSGFDLDVDAIFAAIDRDTKLIFLCSPNNPTGNVLRRNSILRIVKEFKGIVVVDEAYIHYSDESSLIGELDAFPNLIVLQTFSKAWGMAGVRAGVAIANERIISYLKRIKLPYNVNSISQHLIAGALRKLTRVDESIEQTKVERELLRQSLGRFKFVGRVYPSDANFLLTRVSEPAGLYRFLMTKGIAVRDFSDAYLCDGCLRITVGTPQENRALLNALEAYEKSLVY